MSRGNVRNISEFTNTSLLLTAAKLHTVMNMHLKLPLFNFLSSNWVMSRSQSKVVTESGIPL